VIKCQYTVECPAPVNGKLDCPGSKGFYQDNCFFICNPGYQLRGPSNGTCLADQSWSKGNPICVALNCSTSPPLDNSQLQSPCDTQYQSKCTVLCDQGYTRDASNITYSCNITTEPHVVKWAKIRQPSCERGTETVNHLYGQHVAYELLFLCKKFPAIKAKAFRVKKVEGCSLQWC